MTPLWMGFNCLRATKPLQGGRLLMSQGFPNSGKVWGKSEILLGGLLGGGNLGRSDFDDDEDDDELFLWYG